MTTMFLVRHATTAATGHKLGGRTETALDEAGMAQANSLADRLAGVPIKAVYASPLRRTVQTAEAVAARHSLDVRSCDGLLEVDYGRWTDRPLGQVSRTKQWTVVQQRPSLVAFPDGETIRGAQQRAVDTLETIVAAHPRDVVVAVSHADVIKAVLAFYLGMPLDSFQRLHVGPASVTILELSSGGRPVLLRLGDDGPLDGQRFVRRRRPRSRAASRAGGRTGAGRGGQRAGRGQGRG